MNHFHSNAAKTILRAQAEEWSGELTLTAGTCRSTLTFFKGRIVFTAGGESLGRRLLREGALRFDQYVALSNAAIEDAGRDADAAFARVLVAREILAPEAVRQALAFTRRERVLFPLSSTDVEAELTATTAARPSGDLSTVHLVGRVETLLVEAARRLDARAMAQVLRLEETRYLTFTRDAARTIQAFAATARERASLARVDGTRPLHAIAESLGDGDGHALLAALVLAGAVLVTDHPTSARRPDGGQDRASLVAARLGSVQPGVEGAAVDEAPPSVVRVRVRSGEDLRHSLQVRHGAYANARLRLAAR